MRCRLDVLDPVLLQFLLKLRGPAPVRVLPAVIGQHLLRHAILADAAAVHLQHIGSRLTPEDFQAGDIPRVIVDKADDVRLAPGQTKRENIRLPQLVRRRPLEETRTRHIPLRLPFRRRVHQPLFVQTITHRLRTGRQTEPALQHITDPLHAECRVLLLRLDDLVHHRLRQTLFRLTPRLRLQPLLTTKTVVLHPFGDRVLCRTEFLADHAQRVSFF